VMLERVVVFGREKEIEREIARVATS